MEQDFKFISSSSLTDYLEDSKKKGYRIVSVSPDFISDRTDGIPRLNSYLVIREK